MKVLYALLLISLSGALFSQENNKRHTVAVLEFNSGDLNKKDLSILTSRFRSILVNMHAFDVLEREKMVDILKEQDFALADNCNSSECAIEVGKLLGTELIIAGDVGKLGSTYTLDMRLIEVSTGRIVQSQSHNYRGEVDGLLDAMTFIANAFAGTKQIDVAKETEAFGIFIDPRDSTSYRTITIGKNVWLAENLKFDAGFGTYCYDDNATNCTVDGKLYTWEAAKKAIPPHWHLPSLTEFQELLIYLGGGGKNAYEKLIVGGNAKFDMLFTGWRDHKNRYRFRGPHACIWSSTEYDHDKAWYLYGVSTESDANIYYYDKRCAFSVRCVRD